MENTCFICSGDLDSALNLGELYPSTFLTDTDPLPPKKNLCLLKCRNCGLVQLDTVVDPDDCYREYWYRSALNASMLSSLKDVVAGVEKRINLKDDDTVIDIGCNDGSLLKFYSNKNLFKIGFDPALNLRESAEKNCNIFINDYYSAYTTPVYLGVGEEVWFNQPLKAKVITAIAMFYDLQDPNKFVEDIKRNLHHDGIFVIQMTDLFSMLNANAFDNICHEHLEVYSLETLNNLLASHDLQIFDLEYNNVNGGSLRTYAKHKKDEEESLRLTKALADEREFLSRKENSFPEFEKRIQKFKNTIVRFIENKKVFALGASTKGNTLLQYFGIDSKLVPYAAEVNSDKFGLKTVGTNIRIISEKEAIEMQPEVFLVLPWHFRDGLIKNFKNYLEKGGKLLFPLPEPELVSIEGVTKLEHSE